MSMTAGSMAPTISAGDRVFAEGFTFLFREPRRGDIVTFRTDDLSEALAPSGQIWVKRVVGEPGDHLRISDGKLFINGKQVSIRNKAGEITFELPTGTATFARHSDITVPSGCYFVTGDNSTNSLDSRFFGSLPRRNIIGRVSSCYWPPQRMGSIK